MFHQLIVSFSFGSSKMVKKSISENMYIFVTIITILASLNICTKKITTIERERKITDFLINQCLFDFKHL